MRQVTSDKLQVTSCQAGFTQHHFQISKNSKNGAGFTLIELIIYLAIVSIMLVSLSYLTIDIIGGQTKSYALKEVNQNLRFISNNLTKDIKAAADISSVTSDTLVLVVGANSITYSFDNINKKITRQVGSTLAADLNTSHVAVTGNFSNLSYLNRSKNISIHLEINYKNPGNLPDYNASTTADLSVELRGRR